jgi:hypothetical protein
MLERARKVADLIGLEATSYPEASRSSSSTIMAR